MSSESDLDNYSVIRSFAGGVTIPEDIPVSKDALIALIAPKVAEMLDTDMEMLMSSLYRMDVDEGKIKIAMNPNNPVPPAIGISTLIVERQIERNRTKAAYKSKFNSADLTDFEW